MHLSKIWQIFPCTKDQAASYRWIKNTFTENTDMKLPAASPLKLLKKLIDISSNSSLRAHFLEVQSETAQEYPMSQWPLKMTCYLVKNLSTHWTHYNETLSRFCNNYVPKNLLSNKLYYNFKQSFAFVRRVAMFFKIVCLCSLKDSKTAANLGKDLFFR